MWWKISFKISFAQYQLFTIVWFDSGFLEKCYQFLEVLERLGFPVPSMSGTLNLAMALNIMF